MPQALKPLCLVHFWSWENSPFSVLALWGNKNWPHSIKVKQFKNLRNIIGANGCKWSNLNAPGTQNPLSCPFLSLLALWGNKNWPPRMKVKKLQNLWNKIGLKGCNWSSLNAPGTENSLWHPFLELREFPFPITSPLG